jgi:hypothetical protein
LTADDDVLLSKAVFEQGAIATPPRRVDARDHDLDDHDVIALRSVRGAPPSFSRGAGVCGQTAEPLGQLAPDGVELAARDPSSHVVEQWEKDLNKVHAEGEALNAAPERLRAAARA